jgi:hypothetical protein
MPARRSPFQTTPLLPFGALRNSNLFSNHWLEHRLPLEPEWTDLRAESDAALSALAALWRQQRPRVDHYRDEQGLEQAFIQPLLSTLGWKLKYQTWLQGRKPDYALFLDDAALDTALKAGRQAPEFWHYPGVLADAKAWHVNLDRPTGVGSQREYPPEQIEWYLDRSRLPYAILTNGRLWRLIPRQLAPGKARFQTYLEADIPRLLDGRVAGNGRQLTMEQEQATAEEFLRFYLFFSPRAFQSVAGRAPLVERALRGSSEYALSVGEGLKGRVFEALRLCIEGFLTNAPNGLDPARDLELCREQSFVLLYRLLFIMYAEDRFLLPYRRNPQYTRDYSLGRRRDEIALGIDRGQEPGQPGQTTLWKDLVDLFQLIDSGKPRRYGVAAYNGGLFDPERHDFLTQKALPDRYLVRVIDQIGRAEDPQHPEGGLFRVDYRDLAIQHLGSIYEGLLELRPRFATEPMVVIRERGSGRTSERTVPESNPIPKGWDPTSRRYLPGEVYLETDKGERRATGSYYTPDHIVNYIVEHTLGPLCRDVEQRLKTEIAEVEDKRKHARGANREALESRLERLRADYDDRVLRLRVLDPAMGSGHFLVRACLYLAEDIATNPYTADPGANQLNGDEPILTYWKRRVVESCIFGVDLNPMAVELAKLALWLETVSKDAPLSFLDHHLRPGNSLIGARVVELGALPGAMELQQNVFKQQVEQRLPILLEPLNKIRALPSESMEQIKEKDRLYRKSFQPVCDMFRGVADLWCSTFFAPPPQSAGVAARALARPQSEPGAQATGHDVASAPRVGRVASAPRGRRRRAGDSPDNNVGHRGPTLQTDAGVSPEQYSEALNALQTDAAFRNLAKQPWFEAAVAAVRAATVTAFHWELEFPEVFFDLTGRRAEAGFDAVIGNPPYDVLSERETGRDLSPFKAFIEHEPLYTPSRRGKNNLYKLFICRAIDLLAEAGRFGFIVPMALLGDDQAADLRRAMLDAGALTSVEAFPQKDDPSRRVFAEAKLSTCVFAMVKTSNEGLRRRPFTSRQHPADKIEPDSPSLQLRTDDIPLYDPSNRGIVSCSQADWDLAVRIMQTGRLVRLGTVSTSYQGEVNETTDGRRGCLSDDRSAGPLVLRGANVCLYLFREASQGEDKHIRVANYLRQRSNSPKARHGQQPRVGFQRSSPQNNFRRIVAAMVPPGSFCFDTVSYVPESDSRLPLEVLLALLNSKLLDWYFRLGSTNSKVNEYQFNNLPCPVFGDSRAPADDRLRDAAVAAINAGSLDDAFAVLTPALANPPFPLAVQDVLVELVRRIIAIEHARGEIARTQRSALAPAAQPLQDLIDRLLYRMAGLTPDEAAGLEHRLARML